MTPYSRGRFGAKAPGFERPTQVPRDAEEHRRWQDANRAWWEATPMRYDWDAALGAEADSTAYFEEIDRRFFGSARHFLPWRARPFDFVIPFDELGDKDVLEVGVGQGTHAQLIARHCRSFTGIDLTRAAVSTAARRFQLFGVPARVAQMDAERMGFRDASFDYVWSWGVVHHTADPRRALEEIHRVLRPGGRCGLMVYYRSWWSYHVAGFAHALLRGEALRPGGVPRARQAATDGALARYYRPGEWHALVRGLFAVERLRILGLKSDVLLLPAGWAKRAAMGALPDGLARLLTTRLRMGSLMVVEMRKPAPPERAAAPASASRERI
ncbi:MAG TPA: class I SAM-dependent methyltransferase [Alphaproteobacteria bacterium]|nr:class I SAM-dependent methyltransferase [Alphaproteobacteria bacterium]